MLSGSLACIVILTGCTAKPDPQPLRDRDLALYLARLIDEHTVHRIVADTLRTGDTLLRRLVARGLPHRASLEMVEASRGVDYLARSYPGETYEVRLDGEGNPSELRYRRNDGRVVVIEDSGGSFSSRVEVPEVTTVVRAATGVVEQSLYQAFTDCGLSPELVLQFADVFAWTFDFLTECRVGDEFGLVFSERDNPPRVTLLGASYRQAARQLVAVGVQNPDGGLEYFAPDGSSLHASFLRSPLNYRRITSGFSFGRLHPVFKVRRPHLGVDYAAPAGTPVVAVADGAIAFAGRKGGFGNYVEIKHAGGCVTTYGHLRGMAKGVTRGSRVEQGQVIGYVGATGVATGPHLDYRVIVQGRHVNPLRFEPPRGPALDQSRLPELRLRTLLVESALAHADSSVIAAVGVPAQLLCAEACPDTAGVPSLPEFNHSHRDLVRANF
jgi:hypothetical protein